LDQLTDVLSVLSDDVDSHSTMAMAGLCLWGWTWGWGGGWGCFDYGPLCGAEVLDQVAAYGADVCFDGVYDVTAYDGGGVCDTTGFEACDTGAVDAVTSVFDVGGFLF